MRTKLALAIALLALAAPIAATAAQPTPRARVVAALRAEHLRMRLDGTFKYEFFAPSARAYWNLNGEVILWQFRSAARGRRAAATIRPDGDAVGGYRTLWKGLPHWYHRGSVVALYLGGHAWMRRALRSVLGRQIAGSG